MVALSFQKQFAPPILTGTKPHTIRGKRKRPIRPGQKLHLYTGMRTKFCRLFATATCESVSDITIILTDLPHIVIIHADGGKTTIFPSGLDEFARSDGFPHYAAMVAFWRKHHPDVTVFNGDIIRWTGLVLAPEREAVDA